MYTEIEKASPFPIVMGNEEETGMQINFRGRWEDPYRLLTRLPDFVPPELQGADNGPFLKNGFKVYVGRSKGAWLTNLERATPECTNPNDTSLYIRAGELVLTALCRAFAHDYSMEQLTPVHVRIQRRVVDSAGNRKGCHDNFSYNIDTEPARTDPYPEAPLAAHLATRSFMTGAGHVTADGLFYAQKINGLIGEFGYGFDGTMYRVAEEEYHYPRLEIRCSDINISEWATTIRIGGTALLLAMLRTPMRGSIMETSSALLGADSAVDLAKRANELYIDLDGRVAAESAQLNALAFQQYLAEGALDRLQLYAEIPDGYYRIAREMYKYCDDYRHVLTGQKDLSVLGDRADWAAKFTGIIRLLEKNRAYGETEDIGGITGQAADLKYDYIGIGAEGGVVSQKEGWGYKLRRRGVFSTFLHTDHEVARAYRRPPADTRAFLRSRLLEYRLAGCTWQEVTVYGDQGCSQITLFPRQTEMREQDIQKLKNTAAGE